MQASSSPCTYMGFIFTVKVIHNRHNTLASKSVLVYFTLKIHITYSERTQTYGEQVQLTNIENVIDIQNLAYLKFSFEVVLKNRGSNSDAKKQLAGSRIPFHIYKLINEFLKTSVTCQLTFYNLMLALNYEANPKACK